MRRLSLVGAAIILVLAGEAAASSCYLPIEVEADQAIRLRAKLKAVSEICKDPTYAAFARRNRDTYAAYEEILAEHFARDHASSSGVAGYVAGLEKSGREAAGASPGFCAGALDLVTLAAAMRPSDLRAYAAASAEGARTRYAMCGEPAREAPQEDATASAAAPVVAASADPTVPSLAGEDEDGLLATLAGSELGRMLDPADRRQVRETTQQTLENAPVGRVMGWRNPFSRNAGTVMAAQPFRNFGQWCRRFEQSITVAGEVRRAKGTACRRGDGSWEIQP